MYIEKSQSNLDMAEAIQKQTRGRIIQGDLMTFGPKGSDLKKSILKSRKGYLKVRFLGIL